MCYRLTPNSPTFSALCPSSNANPQRGGKDACCTREVQVQVYPWPFTYLFSIFRVSASAIPQTEEGSHHDFSRCQ
uniref:zinc finger protein 667 isoform X3 n=1 Tax=Panthera onca TaxID=9690 RepID=UPI002954FEEF|nr:zinc finger protein 667 isoform X3 [Panthera onca]